MSYIDIFVILKWIKSLKAEKIYLELGKIARTVAAFTTSSYKEGHIKYNRDCHIFDAYSVTQGSEKKRF